MSGSVPLRLPRHRRPARSDARLVGSWLQRDVGTPPLTQPPTLLTVVGTDFMDRLFAAARHGGDRFEPGRWGQRVAYRDWGPLPSSTRDLRGAARLAPSLKRREPLPGELEEAAPLARALADEAEGDTWIRKLYLPLHQHFTLIHAELLCAAPGQPRVDPARVVEVGLVVRRLVLAEGEERWEDWIQSPEGDGVWEELAGVDRQLQRGGRPLDPRALPLDLRFVDTTDVALRGRLGVTDPARPHSLAVTAMAPIPALGEECKRHTARYAVLPLLTRELSRPAPSQADSERSQVVLAAQTRATLERELAPERLEATRARVLELVQRVQALGWAQADSPTLPAWVKSAHVWFYAIPELSNPWVADLSGQSPFVSNDRSLFCLGLLAAVTIARVEVLRLAQPPEATVLDPDMARMSTLRIEVESLEQRGLMRGDRPPSGVPQSYWQSLLIICRLCGELECNAEDLALTLERSGGESESPRAQALGKLGSTSQGDVLLRAWLLDPTLPLVGGLLITPSLVSTPDEVNTFISTVEEAILKTPIPKDSGPPLPRFDPDHIYAAWCFARVRGDDPCEADQLVWSERTEPYLIADAMDLLGLPPVHMRLPDLPRLIADIPRIARARANPTVSVITPASSGVAFDDPPDVNKPRRSLSVAWVCSFGIPVFTICAWILFLFIFAVLIVIPSFAWMALLRICMPLPTVKRA